MKDGSGAIIPPNADFARLPRQHPDRRPGQGSAPRRTWKTSSRRSAAAGIARNDLYLAWDFTVASQRNLTERLLFMRDDALRAARHRRAGVHRRRRSRTTSTANIFRRVTGTFQVERYVDNTVPPARMLLDANGLPLHQATPQPATFICNIPRAALPTPSGPAVPARARSTATACSARTTRSAAATCGDGQRAQLRLLRDEVDRHVRRRHRQRRRDPRRTSRTSRRLTDRLQQAMLNQLFLARLMIHPNGFVANPPSRTRPATRSSTRATSSTTATARAASSAARSWRSRRTSPAACSACPA